jgi:hypothetical protein
MPFRQLAEELREVYKEKRESTVPKHNDEEQSWDKRKVSKRHQCQVGMCLLQEMHAVTLLKI